MNKRIKNKKQKQADVSKLRALGYKKKAIKRLNNSEKSSEIIRSDNRSSLVKAGVPINLVDRFSLDIKPFDSYSKRSLSDLRRRGKKLAFLEDNGVKFSGAFSDLDLSWKKLTEKYGVPLPVEVFDSRKEYEGPCWLYIGFSEVLSDIRIPNTAAWSDDDLIYRIQERYADAMVDPFAYALFTGVFAHHTGPKSECEIMAKSYFNRGYKASAGHRKFNANLNAYSKVTLKNRYSQRTLHTIIYSCMVQMLNADIPAFLSDIEYLCTQNKWPFYQTLDLGRVERLMTNAAKGKNTQNYHTRHRNHRSKR